MSGSREQGEDRVAERSGAEGEKWLTTYDLRLAFHQLPVTNFH
ncbi:hypothetical protein [Scytonema millei]|nr:hypothetical protein [Scytonema millei]